MKLISYMRWLRQHFPFLTSTEILFMRSENVNSEKDDNGKKNKKGKQNTYSMSMSFFEFHVHQMSMSFFGDRKLSLEAAEAWEHFQTEDEGDMS